MNKKIHITLLSLFFSLGFLSGNNDTGMLDCVSFFTWEPVAGTNTSIQFQNESTGTFNTWMWDFGDGHTSELYHPMYEFADFGVYIVCLTVSDGLGSIDTYCDTVEVAPDCHADYEFTYVPTTPIYVQFADISLGYPDSWHWDFGDGTSSSEQNPVHPYEESGSYEVCLTIQHNDSLYYCIDSVCQTIIIPDSVDCEAAYTFEINPYIHLEVSFFDQSSGNITDWEWDFGDGEVSLEQYPVHVFPAPGEYLVCLNVFNADSLETCFHFICKTLNLPDSMLCEADYYAIADSSSNVMYHYTFHDQSTGYPDHWLWDFGDGNISHDQHPVHVYDEAGVYEVCLSSWNSNYPGCSDIQCKLLQTANYYKLGGQAFIGPNPINNPYHAGDTGVAILYRQRPNLGLVAVDTNIFTEFGYYWFADKMEMPYVISISLTKGSENYQDVIPSYYPSAMTWQQSESVVLEEDMFETHTSLIEVSGIEAGIAGIRGRVVSAENRWELVGMGLFKEVPVILTDVSSQPLAWTRTDDHGRFSFDYIAYGTYKVYADIAGIYSFPETLILDENFPVADSVFIKMFETAPLAINEPDEETITILELYPNPANSNIYLGVSAEEPGLVEILIYNQLGQKMSAQSHRISKGENKLEISISNLPESIYYLRLQATKSKPLMRTFIKVD